MCDYLGFYIKLLKIRAQASGLEAGLIDVIEKASFRNPIPKPSKDS